MSNRPWVTLKLATSLDGRIATASGESRWITGELAREMVHGLRAAHDAVMVGAETALADDPELTARIEPSPPKQPTRVVADSRLRLPDTSRLIRTAGMAPVIVLIAHGVDPLRRAVLSAKGVRTLEVPRTERGLDPEAMLMALADVGIQSVFLEGGGQMAASFLAADLVDRIDWFRAPILMGDDARPAIGPLGLRALADARKFARTKVREVGPDLHETLERRR